VWIFNMIWLLVLVLLLPRLLQLFPRRLLSVL
jgi:hypothetical protein